MHTRAIRQKRYLLESDPENKGHARNTLATPRERIHDSEQPRQAFVNYTSSETRASERARASCKSQSRKHQAPVCESACVSNF
jgi:hypothetical protein